MRQATESYKQMTIAVPSEIRNELNLSFAISDKIASLMAQQGLSKIDLARSLGKRPSEITKWLSGQHNFTLATLVMLANFFGQPIVTVMPT